jgi:DNA-binding XRE family transcriptional regulator
VTVAVITQPLILGQAIKTARRAQGLTQVALADEVGTYPRVIIDIERGRSTADLRLILAITARLAITVFVESP